MPQLASHDLLIEFLTEELPPINLEQTFSKIYNDNSQLLPANPGDYMQIDLEQITGQSFSGHLLLELKNFITPNARVNTFVTPRRFGLILTQISNSEPEKQNLRKGPAIAHALNNGEPTQALLGFAKSCVLNWHDLEQNTDGYFYAKQLIKGRALEDVLPDAINNALKKLPIAKNMRWGSNAYHFVRPVHNLLILSDNKVICKNSQFLGLTPNDYTYGHRIMSEGKITISSPATYVETMEKEGKAVVNFDKRRSKIEQKLASKALELNLTTNDTPGLLDEVTALVEHPVVLQGEFNVDFLKVPQECLILSMAKNQKYFALLDSTGKLSNKFLFVANLESKSPQTIIGGNEKVLAARLNDAKFFFETDQKHQLGYFVEKLRNVTYHNKLGSQRERVDRLERIAEQLAEFIGVRPKLAKDTAHLLKADLTTEMVGEFPELQGVIGKYYARNQGKSEDVANAIEQHYFPRSSHDKLPESDLAIIMALSDKLETLVGILGIGYTPTGDKDPFALRRAALGIVRILLQNEFASFELNKLLDITYSVFKKSNLNLNSNTIAEVHKFIVDRLENYLETKYSKHCVQSALSPGNGYLDICSLRSLLNTLKFFAADPSNKPLLQDNKRIKNILKAAHSSSKEIDWSKLINKELLNTPEEQTLYNVLTKERAVLKYDAASDRITGQIDFNKYFITLTEFNQPITDFFDKVMVEVDDLGIRNNRLILLSKLNRLLNFRCDLSKLT
jgi:glycyl-tRNA synthetase beta chain